MSNLKLNDMSFAYGENETPIFSNVNLEFKEGEVFGIFAPNGTGKSTLLQHILNAKAVNKKSIGYIPQKYNESFFNWLSIKNNIQLIQKTPLKEFENNSSKIQGLAKELNIDIDLGLRPLQCSGGMLQQASVLRAFSIDPEIIIADEPFSSLDYNISEKISTSIRKIVKEQNIIMIVVLHNIEDIKALCDRVIAIPSKPFSTSDVDGYYKATIMENEFIASGLDSSNGLNSFMNFVKSNLTIKK